MSVAGFDTYVNALGGVAAGGGAVMVVDVAQEIGEGFDLAMFGFLIADFFGFSFGIIMLHAQDGAVFGGADFKFQRLSLPMEGLCCREGCSRLVLLLQLFLHKKVAGQRLEVGIPMHKHRLAAGCRGGDQRIGKRKSGCCALAQLKSGFGNTFIDRNNFGKQSTIPENRCVNVVLECPEFRHASGKFCDGNAGKENGVFRGVKQLLHSGSTNLFPIMR